jgi:hypothetical protein
MGDVVLIRCLTHTVNKVRIRPLEKRSGGSGSHRRAKPEEAGARGSRVKNGFLGGV